MKKRFTLKNNFNITKYNIFRIRNLTYSMYDAHRTKYNNVKYQYVQINNVLIRTKTIMSKIIAVWILKKLKCT